MKTINHISLIRMEAAKGKLLGAFSHPGLALPIVGTVLKNNGYNVDIFIENILPLDYEKLSLSDIAGFSVNSSNFIESYGAARQIKEKNPECIIIFGGPHVSFLSEQALTHADFVVRGEGESTILDLMKAIERRSKTFHKIDGLSWKSKSGKMFHNKNRELEKNIDLVPDYSLVTGLEKYLKSFTQKIFPMGILVSTSRGCPYNCNFCSIPQSFGSKIRYRSIDSVIEDLERQTKFSGHSYIFFADDNFGLNPEYTKKLLHRIIDSGLKIKFCAQVMSEITKDQELIKLLVRAGCWMVFVGFESINESTLNNYNKAGRPSLEKMEKAVSIFKENKIKIHAMFVVGADTDHETTCVDTAKWCLKNNVDSIQIVPICPLPGTGINDKLNAEGRIYTQYSAIMGQNYINYGGGFLVIIKPLKMDSVVLQKDIANGYKVFYNYKQVIRQVPKFLNKDFNPFFFRLIGTLTIRKSRKEVEEHIVWLSNQN